MNLFMNNDVVMANDGISPYPLSVNQNLLEDSCDYITPTTLGKKYLDDLIETFLP